MSLERTPSRGDDRTEHRRTRPSPRRRTSALLGTLAVAGALLVAMPASSPRAATAAVAATTSRAAATGPLYRFVSMPDFINSDYGDTRVLAGWDPGEPVTFPDSETTYLHTILETIRAERPSFVLDGGDLVNGHWEDDVLHTGIFGPSATDRQRHDLAVLAGHLYYRTLLGLFSSTFGPGWVAYHGPSFFPQIGDHDIGDNPWRAGTVKTGQVGLHKYEFSKYFTRLANGAHRFGMHPAGPSAYTAYAFRRGADLFVSIDDFYRSGSGVRLTLDPQQLAWLTHRLSTARSNGVRHIVVQGHLPVIGASLPYVGSSRLRLEGGAGSAFWRVLKRFHVDLYLAGEFHAVSVRHDGPYQVVHGSVPSYGKTNYLVGDVYPDRIVVTVKELRATLADGTGTLQMPWNRYDRKGWVYDPQPTVVRSFVVPRT